ncbi:MAG: sulfatase family protein [Planctomycetota bacterium]|jgi:iduronate 2-sulfatase
MRLILSAVIACVVVALSAAERPNIIWIEADDLHPDFVGKVGYGLPITPNLDQLITEGVYFTGSVAQAPMCGPSRNTLVTNLYPHNLGFYRNGHMRSLPEGGWAFPQELQKAGYQTAYIGKSHIKPYKPKGVSKDQAHAEQLGFDYAKCTGERFILWKKNKDGVDISNEPFIKHLKERGTYDIWLKDNTGYPTPPSSVTDDNDYLDGYTTLVAEEWLRSGRDGDKPFFLWFNFCLPHGPYDAPQAYHDAVANLDIPPPPSDSFSDEMPAPLLADNHPVKSAASVVKDRRGEAANVLFMDKMVGRLRAALEEQGLLDNTVIIFFSDHSIFLGAHGRKHKGSLFRECLDSSLIVRYPVAYQQDTIVSAPVELLDLVPTTFDIAGIAEPESVAKNGSSIVPLLTGAADSVQPYAFSEILGAQGAYDGEYRYIRSEGSEFLYHLPTDPIEMVNLITKEPSVAERFRQAVEEWFTTSGPVHPPKTF